MHPTAPLFRSIRRLALNTKQAGKDYYKGNRTGSMGRHTKWGGYIVDYKKVRTYVCPDLAGFNVRQIQKKTPRKLFWGQLRGSELLTFFLFV